MCYEDFVKFCTIGNNKNLTRVVKYSTLQFTMTKWLKGKIWKSKSYITNPVSQRLLLWSCHSVGNLSTWVFTSK